MDTQSVPPRHASTAEAFGRLLGAGVVSAVVVMFASAVLLTSWNVCVPPVFGFSEINLSQSLAMLGIAWTLTAIARYRI